MRFLSALLAALFLLAPAAALAIPFDLIYADRADITLCDGCGITLSEFSYAILVNTGPAPITVAEMDAAVFHTTASEPGFTFTPFLNNWGPTFTDLAPGHARGPSAPPLMALLQPSEFLEDTWTQGQQFLAFEVRRDAGTTYEGPVNFHVIMELAGGWIEYDVLADMKLGAHAIFFSHATRRSAIFPPLPTRKSTWGALKSLYR